MFLMCINCKINYVSKCLAFSQTRNSILPAPSPSISIFLTHPSRRHQRSSSWRCPREAAQTAKAPLARSLARKCGARKVEGRETPRRAPSRWCCLMRSEPRRRQRRQRRRRHHEVSAFGRAQVASRGARRILPPSLRFLPRPLARHSNAFRVKMGRRRRRKTLGRMMNCWENEEEEGGMFMDEGGGGGASNDHPYIQRRLPASRCEFRWFFCCVSPAGRGGVYVS